MKYRKIGFFVQKYFLNHPNRSGCTASVFSTIAVTIFALMAIGLTACSHMGNSNLDVSNKSIDQREPATVKRSSRLSSVSGGGAGDGGGGTTTTSTDQDVKDAVAWAFRNMTDAPNNEMPVLGGIFKYNFEVDGRFVLTVITNPQSYREFTKVKYDNPGDYLKLSKVYFKKNGPCPSSNHTDAAASVSKHAYGADICFSLSELKAIPHAALRSEVLALWMHEMAHISGYNEDIAVRVQNIILDHWAELTGTDGTWNKDSLVYSMDGILSGLQYSILELSKTSNPSVDEIIKISELKGRLIEIFSRLPSRINFTFAIARPELEDSVSAKMQNLFSSFNQVVERTKKGISRQIYIQQTNRLIQQVYEVKLLMENYFEGRHFDVDDPIKNPPRD